MFLSIIVLLRYIKQNHNNLESKLWNNNNKYWNVCICKWFQPVSGAIRYLLSFFYIFKRVKLGASNALSFISNNVWIVNGFWRPWFLFKCKNISYIFFVFYCLVVMQLWHCSRRLFKFWHLYTFNSSLWPYTKPLR